MGSFNEILAEITRTQSTDAMDSVRRKYMRELSEKTGRNTVAYYSGWLQRNNPDIARMVGINDEDKTGFMSCFAGIEFEKGLDLIIHSPGGDVAATESIIDYLRSKFSSNIRVIVPQISMSGGTMIACAGKEIIMGQHSNLGPIDPQFGSIAAIAVLKEFERAADEIKKDVSRAHVWQPIIGQYPPTFLSRCHQAIEWSREIGLKTLLTGMFENDSDKDTKANLVVERLLSAEEHKAHGRHLHIKDCKEMGLKIMDLESDQALQDLILSVHHAYTITLMNTTCTKIIENDKGVAFLKFARTA